MASTAMVRRRWRRLPRRRVRIGGSESVRNRRFGPSEPPPWNLHQSVQMLARWLSASAWRRSGTAPTIEPILTLTRNLTLTLTSGTVGDGGRRGPLGGGFWVRASGGARRREGDRRLNVDFSYIVARRELLVLLVVLLRLVRLFLRLRGWGRGWGQGKGSGELVRRGFHGAP